MVSFVLCQLLIQNSSSYADSSEMESLKKECELAKKKCIDAQEKYFSESDRLKAIIDDMQGMVLLAFILCRHVTLAFESLESTETRRLNKRVSILIGYF